MPSPFIFDGPNKLIILDTGVTSITVSDMWGRWVDWLALDDNLKWLPALRQVGADPISETKSLGSTFFLTNGWRIRPEEADHRLTVIGNLYTDPAGFSPFIGTIGNFNVTIESQVSSLVDSAISQLYELEQLSFEGVVRVDQGVGVAGTAYPNGSRTSPINNFTDAVAVAAARGVRALRTSGIYTTTIGEVISGKTFSGYNLNNDRIITVANSALIGCDYENMWVSGPGAMGGTYIECFLQDIPTLVGGAKDSGFLGEFSFIAAPPLAFQAFDCHTTNSLNSVAFLNMVPTVKVLLHRCSGHWVIKGMTADDHVFNMIGGHIEIDSTCTGGTVTIRGDARLTNNSTGVTVVDDRQMSSGMGGGGATAQETANAVWAHSYAKKLMTVTKFLGLK
jgi:hypothetical protein